MPGGQPSFGGIDRVLRVSVSDELKMILATIGHKHEEIASALPKGVQSFLQKHSFEPPPTTSSAPLFPPNNNLPLSLQFGSGPWWSEIEECIPNLRSSSAGCESKECLELERPISPLSADTCTKFKHRMGNPQATSMAATAAATTIHLRLLLLLLLLTPTATATTITTTSTAPRRVMMTKAAAAVLPSFSEPEL